MVGISCARSLAGAQRLAAAMIAEQLAGSATTQVTVEGCFIATAAYGSPSSEQVEFLRDLRDNILRRTRAGSEFFTHYWQYYYRISPPIAEEMRRDPELRRLLRWSIVDPWLNYMRLVHGRPDWEQVAIDRLPADLRDFVVDLRQAMKEVDDCRP